jgi:hypothetical protein
LLTLRMRNAIGICFSVFIAHSRANC